MDRLAKLLEMERVSPGDPFLKYAVAMDYLAQGKEAESRPYFERLVTDHPDYVATYYQYGKLEEEAGNTAAAETLYKAGIEKATAAGDKKTAGELRAALEMMD